MFFDLVMAGINVCRIDDIALSVLATVIGHQRDKGWIIVDAGWMAMSGVTAAPRASPSISAMAWFAISAVSRSPI